MDKDPMAPTCRPTYPNDVPPEQIEDLISSTTSLQNQVLRKFARAILEEMRYHMWIAQEKCKLQDEIIKKLQEELDKARAALMKAKGEA